MAIDPHHLLTSAHIFELDIRDRNIDSSSLHYLYDTPISFFANPIRIRIRHEHEGFVNRPLMLMFPTTDDYEVQLLAFCDGRDTSTIHTYDGTGFPCSIEKDVAVLYSPRPLPVSVFPKPARYHVPPNNHPHTMSTKPAMLLAYNGVPDISKEIKRYPNTPRNELVKALGEMFGDRLSMSSGMITTRYDRDIISYRISSHSGASGGGLFDEDGNLIGSTLIVNNLTK